MAKYSKIVQSSEEGKVTILRKRIIAEILAAFGFSRNGWLNSIGGKLFYKPAERFARIAARFEEEIPLNGLHGGAQKILPDFPLAITAWGIKKIPKSGPVLIIANHPGAYDSLALVSCIPRKDLKMLVSDIPFSRALTTAGRYFIYVDFTSSGGMRALQSSINHLKNNGAVLIFAHGEVEPDLEFMPGAAESIASWSPSIEIMLRKAPKTKIVLAITSGVFLANFIHHPLTRIRHNPAARQKLAEFLQVMNQLTTKSSQNARVHISFSKIPPNFLSNNSPRMPIIIKYAQQSLEEHLLKLAKPEKTI